MNTRNTCTTYQSTEFMYSYNVCTTTCSRALTGQSREIRSEVADISESLSTASLSRTARCTTNKQWHLEQQKQKHSKYRGPDTVHVIRNAILRTCTCTLYTVEPPLRKLQIKETPNKGQHSEQQNVTFL